jgi:hypothetical protein
MVHAVKTCSKCKVEKQLTAFGKCVDRKDGLSQYCKECWKDHYKAHRQRNLERGHQRYESNKAWILDKNKRRYEKLKAEFGSDVSFPEIKRNRHYKTRYGIDIETYNLLLLQQNHSCLICGVHQKELTKRLAIDHCHQTGKVRGLLCAKCNKGLGQFNDNPELIKRAAAYLI